MHRWVVAFSVMVVGCVASLPDDPGITADLACEGAVIEMQARAMPAPKPADDKCQNCNGTGKIGDGRIVHTCPVCGGTGKRPAAKPVAAAPCPTGVCPL